MATKANLPQTIANTVVNRAQSASEKLRKIVGENWVGSCWKKATQHCKEGYRKKKKGTQPTK